MKIMAKARLRVDFNELVQPDLVLLAKSDLVVDSLILPAKVCANSVV